MILVTRICRLCGRAFKIEHTPGTHMPDHCPSCTLES